MHSIAWDAWMAMIKRRNNWRAVPYRTAKGKTHQNSEGQNVPVVAVDFKVFIVKQSAL